MDNLKYEMFKEHPDDKRYRIRALREINNNSGRRIVSIGDVGGYVDTPYNLSQYNSCWVFNDAIIKDGAIVKDEAWICNKSVISDEAIVSGNSLITGNVLISDYANVYHSNISNYTMISDWATVYDSNVSGHSIINDEALIDKGSQVYDSDVSNCAQVSNSRLEKAKVSQWQLVDKAVVNCDLSKNLIESIRCQTGLIPTNGKIIAYKQVNKNLHSFHDDKFEYKIGEIIKAEFPNIKSKQPCSGGLHFSNANYWTKQIAPKDSIFLTAEIDINDIITVQRGKIRCTKAKILGGYDASSEMFL